MVRVLNTVETYYLLSIHGTLNAVTVSERFFSETADFDDFEEVQAAFLLLLLFFTFCRSESPLPKAMTGQQCFDDQQH